MSEAWLLHQVTTYGPWAVLVCVMLDGLGIPVPSESMLAAAAIAAGIGHGAELRWIIAAGVAGALIGDNVGYAVGRTVAVGVLVRFGPRVGLTAARQRLGKYLFGRYGIGLVFVARFVLVLRTCVSLLAGANQMPWPRFLVANILGATSWATAVGVAAATFGRDLHQLSWPVSGLIAALLAVAAAGAWTALRRAECTLQAEADAAPADRGGRRRTRSSPIEGLPMRPADGRRGARTRADSDGA